MTKTPWPACQKVAPNKHRRFPGNSPELGPSDYPETGVRHFSEVVHGWVQRVFSTARNWEPLGKLPGSGGGGKHISAVPGGGQADPPLPTFGTAAERLASPSLP